MKTFYYTQIYALADKSTNKRALLWAKICGCRYLQSDIKGHIRALLNALLSATAYICVYTNHFNIAWSGHISFVRNPVHSAF